MKNTVLYDGNCKFCRLQIRILKNLDFKKSLFFLSIHDASVYEKFPQLTKEQLNKEMYIITKENKIYSGAEAVKYLSRKLILLWPLALLLHIPFSNGLWRRAYAFVAKNRYRISGCGDSCKLN